MTRTHLAFCTTWATTLLWLLGAGACSPVSTETPSPEPPTPTATSTTIPLPATPTRFVTPLPPPTSAPIVGQPVSKYFAVLNGQAAAPDGVFTLRRLEFWPDVGGVKAKNGLFVVAIGELSSVGGQLNCNRADEFGLTMDTRKFETASALMDPFKATYGWDYPGSFLARCIVKPDPTFLVFDTPLQLGVGRFMYRNLPIELGDLNIALRQSGYLLPTVEGSLRGNVDKALGSGARAATRVLDLKTVDLPPPVSAKNVTVTWLIDDKDDEAKNRDGAKSDATKVFQTAYTAGLNVNQVEVIGVFRTIDVFGKAKDDVVVRLILDKATAAKINWTNFQSKNVYAVSKIVLLDARFKDPK